METVIAFINSATGFGILAVIAIGLIVIANRFLHNRQGWCSILRCSCAQGRLMLYWNRYWYGLFVSAWKGGLVF